MKNTYSAVLILIAAGVGAYFLLNKATPNEVEEPDMVACTMEALICPDGSGVGRQGPRCEFSACPNQNSFTGELKQQGSEFILVVAAPQDFQGEVTYALPLTFSRISNTTGTFVGKQVKVTGKFSKGNILNVETIDFATTQNSTVTLKVGETGYMRGVRITVNKIVEDSRCPIDVQCIQAGKLVASVTLKTDTDTETVDMILGSTRNIDTFSVSLIKALPAPVSTQTQRNYVLTFEVR